MSFSNLKRDSKTKFKQLAEKMTNENKGASFADDRIWQPEVDKSGSRICYCSFSSSN